MSAVRTYTISYRTALGYRYRISAKILQPPTLAFGRNDAQPGYFHFGTRFSVGMEITNETNSPEPLWATPFDSIDVAVVYRLPQSLQHVFSDEKLLYLRNGGGQHPMYQLHDMKFAAAPMTLGPHQKVASERPDLTVNPCCDSDYQLGVSANQRATLTALLSKPPVAVVFATGRVNDFSSFGSTKATRQRDFKCDLGGIGEWLISAIDANGSPVSNRTVGC